MPNLISLDVFLLLSLPNCILGLTFKLQSPTVDFSSSASGKESVCKCRNISDVVMYGCES